MENKKYCIDSIDYDREMYYKELDRKKDFETLLTTPLLTYSFIVTMNYFLISGIVKNVGLQLNFWIYFFAGLVGLALITSIIFLLLFYDNFLGSFNYWEIGNPAEILKMENDFKEEQITFVFAEIHFKEKLKNLYAEYAGYNMKLNVKRLEFFSLCKLFLILSVLVHGCFFVSE
ncbi:hypothetical protein H0S70_01335 [Chryseobacterium manosquense]|uniref:Uncharacterized protein n=1 Tax=Chryseobacterium manosquense TaxID=2754694 RepID=A0A7H1DXF6_9FLAO|nr:hypothetical protein [Chryseobacterium manosquense]QNS41664.1 hypothetical protein H0S70_01335 [Chryseobacterium manosquense]